MGVVYLLGAIFSEVFGSTMLKLAATARGKLPILGIIAGYIISFYLLSLALLSIPLSFGYAVWSGLGTALTAVAGVMIFKEKMSKKATLGIGVLIIGIIMMRL